MLIYCLEYMKLCEGFNLPVRIYYDNLETLLADADEFSLKKGQFKVYELEGKQMDSASILSRFTEEIAEETNGSDEDD